MPFLIPVVSYIGGALGSIGSAVGIGAAGSTASVVGGAAVVGAAGYTAQSTISGNTNARKASANFKRDTEIANKQMIAEAEAIKSTASAQAKGSILKRQQAISRNKTTFTSPLGLNGEANTIKKTLLGE